MKKILFLFVSFVAIFSFFSISFSQNSQPLSNMKYFDNITFSWQVLNSYTPPFYEGRPLPGEQSKIKLVATPDFLNSSEIITQKEFYYEWYINDIYAQTASGIQRNILRFDLSQFENTNKIELKLYEDGKKNVLINNKIIKISPYETLAVVYKQDSSSLIKYSNSISKKYKSHELNKLTSLNILVEPYYFSVTSPEDENLGYFWTQNGFVGLEKSKNVYSITPPEYQYGDISLEIKIKNNKEFLQEAKTLFEINLNE